ncbi:MAG: flagellar protein export ATPase FliI [Armatimonadetes bacterium]|nr:flagellar protein export ATPase FliI [Armatimonadota bacterium]
MIQPAPVTDLSKYRSRLSGIDPFRVVGNVKQIIGLVLESDGPAVSIGEVCLVSSNGGKNLPAEVVGFRDNKVLLMPLGEMIGIYPGAKVQATGHPLSVPVGPELLGRVLDGLGQALDGKGRVLTHRQAPLQASPPDPLGRPRIHEALPMGVRAIDGLNTCGKGQRIGVFSGSGVGKSTLLGMIARNTAAHVNVIALVGERGREVRDFLERDLGEAGLARSVVVVATSDQPALIRIKAALVATTIAEHFRDQGYDVNFMMDSVTRFAMAQREVGLAIGEPPTTRGYTPSVFALLPRLLERSGTSEKGSITGLYTVLVEADDMNEPIADSIRAILDGHIVLSRDLAEQNHYPPVDVLASISRVMIDVVPREHRICANQVREILATHRRVLDLINIGAYNYGSNPKVDHAIDMIGRVNEFLRQEIEEAPDYGETVDRLMQMFA